VTTTPPEAPPMTDAEPRLDTVLTLRDFEPLAAARVETMAWPYLSSGAGDERSLRRNKQAWHHCALVSRILQDVPPVVPLGIDHLGCYRKWAHARGERG